MLLLQYTVTQQVIRRTDAHLRTEILITIAVDDTNRCDAIQFHCNLPQLLFKTGAWAAPAACREVYHLRGNRDSGSVRPEFSVKAWVKRESNNSIAW